MVYVYTGKHVKWEILTRSTMCVLFTLKGGRINYWGRRWRIWKHFANYFPLKLVKTADLDPNKNYIFGCHPHGILCVSAFGNFATEATNFSQMFAGITPHILTLEGQFLFPFHRELFLMTGLLLIMSPIG